MYLQVLLPLKKIFATLLLRLLHALLGVPISNTLNTHLVPRVRQQPHALLLESLLGRVLHPLLNPSSSVIT